MAGVVERLKRHAAGHRAVPDDGDGLGIDAADGVALGNAERRRNRVAAVSGDDGVMGTLGRLHKAGQPLGLPQGVKKRPAPGQQLVGIALVPHVKDDAVLRRVKNAVDGHRQLDHPEVGGQMAAVV